MGRFMAAKKDISFKTRSKTGVLVIHGFTSNPLSMKFYAEKLAKAGFNVECPLLPGHGTKWQDLNRVKYQKWIAVLEESIIKLKKRTENIFVAGLSMGGTLSCRLSETHPEIKGTILINPALLLYKEWRMPFLPIVKYFKEYELLDKEGVRGDLKDPKVAEDHYDRDPLNGAYELYRLIKVTRKNLIEINSPVLFFQSIVDHVVPPQASKYIYERISSKEKKILTLKNSYHVATLDYEKAFIAEKSIEFIKKYSISKGRK
jgi:carboxylesterase